jgi:DNA-binding transcriptional regulator YiaG
MDPEQIHAQRVTMASTFVDTRAATFHSAFSTASTLNAETLEYEIEEVQDLRQTLSLSQQRAGRYIDFTQDLSRCNWETVLCELDKAKDAAEKSKGPVKNPLKWAFRTAGKVATILEPGLNALPDNLSVLHGGLAVVFSVSSIALFENE